MRALSLWQPWADFVAQGWKRVETRSWKTEYRGLLAVHASKHMEGGELHALRLLREGFGRLPARRPDLPPVPFLGGVVAVATLAACVPSEVAALPRSEAVLGDLSPGRFAWVLEDVVALPAPVPVRGRQGLWTLSPEETLEVRHAAIDAASARSRPENNATVRALVDADIAAIRNGA